MFFRICGVAGFKTHDQQAAAGIGHRFQRLVIAVDARGAGPVETHWFEFLAEGQHAVLADVERIVVEEEFLRLRKHLVRLPEFARHILHRTRAPGVAGKRLRPQAEGAQRRASAGGVEGNEGMQQKRHVVLLDRHVLFVNVGGEWQRIQLFGLQQRARRVVDDFAVLHVTCVADFRKRLALRVFDDGMVEFPAHDEIDVRAGQQAFRRLDLHVRADEGDLEAGLVVLHRASHAQVAEKTDGGREQHHEFVVLRGPNHFCRRDVVRGPSSRRLPGSIPAA